MKFVDFLSARIEEPSTWAGLGVILAAVATAFPSTAYYTGGAATVCGLVAAAFKEKGAHP